MIKVVVVALVLLVEDKVALVDMVLVVVGNIYKSFCQCGHTNPGNLMLEVEEEVDLQMDLVLSVVLQVEVVMVLVLGIHRQMEMVENQGGSQCWWWRMLETAGSGGGGNYAVLVVLVLLLSLIQPDYML